MMAEEIEYTHYHPERVQSIRDLLMRLSLIIADNTTADRDVAAQVALACVRFIRECPASARDEPIR